MVKKTLLSMAIAAAVVSLAGCNVSTTDKYDNKIINEGVQYGPASSVYPIFAPEAGQVPLAIDFLFADAADSDGTANTADTTPPVTTALNKLDGFSTVAPLYIEFSADLDPSTVVAGQSVFLVKLRNGVDDPSIDALNIDTILASNPTNPFSSKPITPASYEARYITMDDGRTPAIQILLKEPLEPKTKYLVVLTDGIKGTNGETIGQSTTYAHAIGSDEIVNPDLAPVRGALQGWQQLAQGFLASGTPLVANAKGKAVFNYAFTTGGTDDVLKAMAAPGTFLQGQVAAQITSIDIGEGAITAAVIGGGGNQAAADAQLDAIAGLVATQIDAENPGTLPTTDGATIRPILKSTESLQPYYLTGLRTAITTSQVAALSSKGNIYQGGLSIPNYLPASEAGKADSELGTWVASAAAATALGLDAAPTDVDGSTNVTYRFPFAEKVSDNVIPVFATLPATSECGAKPSDGWPVAIYQHGITVDRTAGVLVGNALANACVAMVAIDHTMHGVAPGNATDLLFSVDTVSNQYDSSVPATAAASPFALARLATAGSPLDPNNLMGELQERHNNVGKNAAQANVEMKFASAGATADVGASGDLYINLQNFARTRDAMRQTVLDLMNLNATIGDMDVDADGNSDFDASKVYFVGHSLGAIIGTTFVAVNNDPDVQAFNGNLPKIQGAILGNGGGGVVKLLENSPSIGGA